MLTINDKQYRNLQEQVRKNKSDVTDIIKGSKMLGEFGIKVLGHVKTPNLLPDPGTYSGDYGDAYAVGLETPYTLYIFTRPFEDNPKPHWFNIGIFPAPSTVPGPKGDSIVGPKGESSKWLSGKYNPYQLSGKYNKDDYYLNTTDGSVFVFDGVAWVRLSSIMGPQGPIGNTGATGPKGDSIVGPKGERGEPGHSFVIEGELSSTTLLPTPTPETRHKAYLIQIDGYKHLYVIVGSNDNLKWVDAGPLQGIPGQKGDIGPQGPQGNTGLQGLKGDTGETGVGILMTTIDSGVVVESGKEYTMTIDYSNDSIDQVKFIAPKGDKGDTGAPGRDGLTGSYDKQTKILTLTGSSTYDEVSGILNIKGGF